MATKGRKDFEWLIKEDNVWLISLCLVAQTYPTLCDPMDCHPRGSSVHGILQARVLKWVSMPSSRRSSRATDQTQVSRIAGGFFTVQATRKACLFSLLFFKAREDLGFPGGSVVKNLPSMQETWVRSLGGEDPLKEGMATTPVFLPRGSHGQRSLAGYSPLGRTESDVTERLSSREDLNMFRS